MKRLITWLIRTGDSNRRFPVHFILALGSLTVLAGAALSTGCTSPTQQAAKRTQQKEAVLQQCGFKAVPVTTAQQLQRIGTLPSGRVSAVQRDGSTYYVFPDPPRKMLYVGREQQYFVYQNYRSNQAENAQYDAISKADPSVAKYNNEAEVLSGNEGMMGWDDASWGAWDQP
jgi:hypothetical protein